MMQNKAILVCAVSLMVLGSVSADYYTLETRGKCDTSAPLKSIKLSPGECAAYEDDFIKIDTKLGIYQNADCTTLVDWLTTEASFTSGTCGIDMGGFPLPWKITKTTETAATCASASSLCTSDEDLISGAECLGTQCIASVDHDRCCEPKNEKCDPDFEESLCDVGTIFPENPSAVSCNGKCTKAKCCTGTPATCATSACANGYVLKPDHLQIKCEEATCDPAKDSTKCCSPKALCNTYSCGSGFTLKKDPGLTCAGSTCGAADKNTCCAAVGTCSSFTCPKIGYTKKPNSNNIKCKGVTCNDIDDRDTCCAENAQCDSSFSCGLGWVLKSNFPAFCQGAACKNEDCCDKKSTCSKYVEQVGACPTGKYASAGYCNGIKCSKSDEAKCCKDQASCLEANCGTGYYPDPSKTCAKSRCTSSDVKTCCKEAGSCSTDFKRVMSGKRMRSRALGPPSVVTIDTYKDIAACNADHSERRRRNLGPASYWKRVVSNNCGTNKVYELESLSGRTGQCTEDGANSFKVMYNRITNVVTLKKYTGKVCDRNKHVEDMTGEPDVCKAYGDSSYTFEIQKIPFDDGHEVFEGKAGQCMPFKSGNYVKVRTVLGGTKALLSVYSDNTCSTAHAHYPKMSGAIGACGIVFEDEQGEEGILPYYISNAQVAPPPATCSTYTCPSGYSLKAGSGNANCKTTKCNAEDDLASCCTAMPAESCSNFFCPPGFTTETTRKCKGYKCDVDLDFDTCCTNSAVKGCERYGAKEYTTDYCDEKDCTFHDAPNCCSPPPGVVIFDEEMWGRYEIDYENLEISLEWRKVGPGWFGVGFDDNCRDLGKNDALLCDNANDGYMKTYEGSMKHDLSGMTLTTNPSISCEFDSVSGETVLKATRSLDSIDQISLDGSPTYFVYRHGLNSVVKGTGVYTFGEGCGHACFTSDGTAVPKEECDAQAASTGSQVFASFIFTLACAFVAAALAL